MKKEDLVTLKDRETPKSRRGEKIRYWANVIAKNIFEAVILSNAVRRSKHEKRKAEREGGADGQGSVKDRKGCSHQRAHELGTTKRPN